MNIQWYPGHMTKAVRMMEENMKLIDLVIELTDARIPFSSRNPDIDRLAGNKMRLVILNKSDLASESANAKWIRYYEEAGIRAVLYNSKSKDGMKLLLDTIRDVCKEKTERDRKRGIRNRSVKAMIVGIPNVGKSTFINNLAGRNAANVGNKPGVTKGKQWIHISNELDLLDTPGILWPKFDNQETGLNIGLIGSINDEILPSEELAAQLIKKLDSVAPGAVEGRYGIKIHGLSGNHKTLDDSFVPADESGKEATNESAYEVLKQIATARKCFKKGEEPDLLKAADILLDEFRAGRLGRITLELPENELRE